MKIVYSKMSQEAFDSMLEAIVDAMSTVEVLAVPGVREIFQEELNNETLDAWAKANPDLAEDWSEEIQKIAQLPRERLQAFLEENGSELGTEEEERAEALALVKEGVSIDDITKED